MHCSSVSLFSATLYGLGVYSAREFSYSARYEYSNPDKDGLKSIIQCGVLTGEFIVGNDKMIEPPEKVPGVRYDSTVDDIDKPDLFVVFADYHMYPQYIVTFFGTSPRELTP